MGVDTKAYIPRDRFSMTEIKEIIERVLNTKVTPRRPDHSITDDYAFFDFKWAGDKEVRSMYIGGGDRSSIGGFDSWCLSLGAFGGAVLIMQKILKVTGGLLQESDTNEDYKAFYPPTPGFIEFCVRQATVEGKIGHGSTREQLAGLTEYIAERKY